MTVEEAICALRKIVRENPQAAKYQLVSMFPGWEGNHMDQEVGSIELGAYWTYENGETPCVKVNE